MSPEEVARKYLVVDTWVLEYASTPRGQLTESQIELHSKAVELLARIIHRCHRVILDYNGDILSEYSSHIRGFVGEWLQMVARYPMKVQYRPRSRVRLQANFDPNDLKFLEVAINSPHRIVISGDSDFLTIKENPDILSQNIRILDLEEALREL